MEGYLSTTSYNYYLTTIDTKLREFQYKILKNVLFLNKRLFTFAKSNTTLCSFCHLEDETVIHLFALCRETKVLWKKLQRHYKNHLEVPAITP